MVNQSWLIQSFMLITVLPFFAAVRETSTILWYYCLDLKRTGCSKAELTYSHTIFPARTQKLKKTPSLTVTKKNILQEMELY